MITRCELDTYQELLKDRDDLKERLEFKKSRLYTIKNQTFSAVGGGGHGDVDKIGAAVAEVDELRTYYYNKVIECERMKKRIKSEFEILEDIERKIMEYRYIDGLWWKDICEKVSLSYGQIHREHRKILTKLQQNI